jgi:hypothetical protein
MVVESEIDELRAIVRAQEARIAKLEAKVASGTERSAVGDPSPTRRQLFRLAGAAAAGGMAATVGGALTAAPAGAADGDNLVLGEQNDATTVTVLTRTADPDSQPLYGTGLVVEAKGPSSGYVMPIAVDAVFTDNPVTDEIPRRAIGVAARAEKAIGVDGEGVWGVHGNGQMGVVADGEYLGLSSLRTRDDSKGHRLGEVWRDDPGAVWLCVTPGGAGQTGRWQKIGGPGAAGQLHVLPSPVRIYDSRPGFEPVGVAKGKLANNQQRTIDANQGGAVPVPASGGTPTAVLVNLTITDSDSVSGFLALFQNGTTWSGSSSINWDASGRTVANTTVVGINADGLFTVRCGAAPGLGTHFLVDVLGYWL